MINPRTKILNLQIKEIINKILAMINGFIKVRMKPLILWTENILY